MAGGPQKPDHGGNFFMVPRRVLDSVAWRHASFRARAVLQVLLFHHNGFNNGEIRITVVEICEAVGDQNKGANGLAIAELIELGFLECTSDANHPQSKARTYRITFIPTGQGKTSQPATHEYADWRPPPGQKRKFGGARTAPQNPLSGPVTEPTVKLLGAETAPAFTESRGIEYHGIGAVTAPLIVNQSEGTAGRSAPSEISSHVPSLNGAKSRRADFAGVDLDELRDWYKATLDHLGYGGQRTIAQDAGVPEPILSKFKAGKGLKDDYRLPLQTACGRVLPYVKWKAAA